MFLYEVMKEDCEGTKFILKTFTQLDLAERFLQEQLVIQDNLREIDEYVVYINVEPKQPLLEVSTKEKPIIKDSDSDKVIYHLTKKKCIIFDNKRTTMGTWGRIKGMRYRDMEIMQVNYLEDYVGLVIVLNTPSGLSSAVISFSEAMKIEEDHVNPVK